jgi:light-regulated signal transduction histidine kinase (bacteriophytochrome)
LGTFGQRVAKLGDGLFVFLDDVTAQRRMERELQAYANLVAHDLSEPLANVQLLVTLIEQRSDVPPSSQVLDQLRRSAVRARELVDGVLAYARSGELECERVELGRVVADVADDLRPALEAVCAELTVGDLPDVEADPRQLRRVFQNLVTNALRFRSAEPPRIDISAAPDIREWLVTVRDNGVGVPAEHTTRIFGMFARLADAHVFRQGSAPAHARKCLEQREAVGCRCRKPEPCEHREIPVAEREVDDRAGRVP